MSDAVEVRVCAAEDVDVLTATEPPGADIARRIFARQCRGESVYLVAWEGDDPVGSGELVLAQPELRSLYVRDEMRGRGVGTALIRAAVEHCAGRGQLSVGVGIANHAARRLYERLGFVGTGEVTTTCYTYVDVNGPHEATETDERLVLTIEPPPPLHSSG